MPWHVIKFNRLLHFFRPRKTVQRTIQCYSALGHSELISVLLKHRSNSMTSHRGEGLVNSVKNVAALKVSLPPAAPISVQDQWRSLGLYTDNPGVSPLHQSHADKAPSECCVVFHGALNTQNTTYVWFERIKATLFNTNALWKGCVFHTLHIISML